MKIEITFSPDGNAVCLHTEALDLSAIGSLKITRASNVEFNNDGQAWEVTGLNGARLFSDHSRARCIEWESENIEMLRANMTP